MKALLLCAGKSTRIASIAKGGPKPLIELGGRSILERNIQWLSDSGIQDIWINLHHRPDDIKTAIRDGSQFRVSIRYVFEPEILGTAGAVRNLKAEWSSTFLVVCADNLYNFSIEPFYQSHKNTEAIATIALFNRETQLNTGIAGGQVVLTGRYIQKFIEGSSEKISPYVNAGAYFLEPEIVNHIPAQVPYDFGRELFPQLLHRKIKIATHVIDGYCLGVDTPDSYQAARSILENQ